MFFLPSVDIIKTSHSITYIEEVSSDKVEETRVPGKQSDKLFVNLTFDFQEATVFIWVDFLAFEDSQFDSHNYLTLLNFQCDSGKDRNF